MNVLVVGAGGREHALAWKLAQSGRLAELHAAPGNPGIARLGTCHPVRGDDAEALLGLCRERAIDLVVIGPEAPLVAGVGDALRHAGIAVFGPSAAAARIEGSKSFAKELMAAAGVPSARSLDVARPPCVVKADGLAAGKGVFVCRTEEDVRAGLAAAAQIGGPVVVEELLEGEELSVFAVCDGTRALALPAARDYKRVGDGDSGPNTGGMGSYAPVADFDLDRARQLVAEVHEPVLRELARRGSPFVGLLYAGLMLTAEGVRVLEFNARFGDPETQSILPLLDGDLLELLTAAAAGDLRHVQVAPAPQAAAVTVVVAAGDYPESGDSGSPIAGIGEAEAAGALVFHAGTALRGGAVVTNGGRILDVVGVGDDVAAARAVAYAGVARVAFPGARHRGDIAAGAAGAGGPPG